MKTSVTFTLLAVACVSLSGWGCGGQTTVETVSTEAGGTQTGASTDGPAIPDSMLNGVPGTGNATSGEQPPVPNYPPIQPQTSTAPAFDPNLPPGGQRVLAEVGVGKKGQSLKDEKGIGGMIAQPARTLFAVEQRAVFDIQIPSAVKLFEATEGRKPKSHDEYMAMIIKANQIKLPELPPGQTYVYDPQVGELMVQKN